MLVLPDVKSSSTPTEDGELTEEELSLERIGPVRFFFAFSFLLDPDSLLLSIEVDR